VVEEGDKLGAVLNTRMNSAFCKMQKIRWIIHTYHAAPLPCCGVALKSRFQNGMVGSRHWRGIGMAWYVLISL